MYMKFNLGFNLIRFRKKNGSSEDEDEVDPDNKKLRNALSSEPNLSSIKI